MTETKSPLASKGVWGAVITILAAGLPTLLHLLKVDGQISPNEVMELVQQGVVVAGGVLALYGRLTARKTLA